MAAELPVERAQGTITLTAQRAPQPQWRIKSNDSNRQKNSANLGDANSAKMLLNTLSGCKRAVAHEANNRQCHCRCDRTNKIIKHNILGITHKKKRWQRLKTSHAIDFTSENVLVLKPFFLNKFTHVQRNRGGLWGTLWLRIDPHGCLKHMHVRWFMLIIMMMSMV